MLKMKDNIELKELEKFGFKLDYYIDSKVYVKEYRKGFFYKEYIILWFKDREIQIRNNGQILLDTIYDLIQAGLVEKA